MKAPIHKILGTGESWGFCQIEERTRSGPIAARLWQANIHYAINLVHDGDGILTDSQGQATRLTPGCLYQHFPDNQAQLNWQSEQVREHYLLIDGRTFERLAAFALFPVNCVFCPPERNAFVPAMQHLARTLSQAGDATGHSSRRLLLATLVQVLAELFDRLDPPLPHGGRDDLVALACRCMDDPAHSRDSLPDIATQLGVSYPLLRKRFRQTMDQSLTRYRIAGRIQRAERLLLTHDVQSTAHELGYPDIATFSKQFKRECGISPTDFQKQFGLPSIPRG